MSNFIAMFSADLQLALGKVYGLSVSKFGFTPKLYALDLSTYVSGSTERGFAIFVNIPVWPAGSSHTPATYVAGLKAAMGTQYEVGLGEVYISIEYRP